MHGMAARRTLDEPPRLHDRFAVVSTGTVHAWASAACLRSRELCEQADAEVRRARRLRRGMAARPDDTVWGRLQAAELRARNLEKAQCSNRRIGMAVGILMCRHGLTEAQAVEALRAVSSYRSVRMREIAEGVIYTGDLRELRTVRPVRGTAQPFVPRPRGRQRA